MRYFLIAAAICLAALPALAQTAAQNPALLLDELVTIDSRGWMFNRYDRGSMRNVQVAQRSSDGRSVVLVGDYTYNGGARGRVWARFDNDQFTCIEFWDFPGRCRALGRSPSQDLVLGAMAAIVVGGGSSAPSAGGQCRTVWDWCRSDGAQQCARQVCD